MVFPKSIVFFLMRARVLHAFAHEQSPIVVSTPLAALSQSIQLDDFKRAYLHKRARDKYIQTARKLSHIGYITAMLSIQKACTHTRRQPLHLAACGSTPL